jgi:hypothetical protein
VASRRPIDIGLASERIRAAAAQLERAQVLWLPTIYLGGDYFRHDGQLQDVAGNIFATSKQSLLLGAGPSAVFAITDAIFAPLAERQLVQAREAALLGPSVKETSGARPPNTFSASVRTTSARLGMAPICFGHIGRSRKRLDVNSLRRVGRMSGRSALGTSSCARMWR